MNEDEMVVQRASAVFTPAAHYYYPMAISRGEGARVISKQGLRFLDFTSALGVLNIGHRHPKVLAAVRAQMESCLHTGGIYYSDATVAAAEALVAITPPGLDMLFFSNSGAEAVEGALKLARYTTARQGIISCTGAFHGRTLGAVSVTSSSSAYRRHYHPLIPSVYQVCYPSCYVCPCGLTPDACGTKCLDDINRLFERQIPPEEVCAIIVEPFLGEGGYYPAPAKYLQGLRAICDQYGILLIFDEVQSGIGRTGKWFCCDHAGVVPDILTTAKALASGLPLSAVVASKKVMQKWEQGAHGTTFGGNPLSCAAARATIEVIREEGLLERALYMGTRALSFLQELASRNPRIGDVRGKGCMIGIEFVDGAGAADGRFCAGLIEQCFANGLILIGCALKRNVVRFIPPINVTAQEMEEALDILAASLAELS
jgi:4-aminobutyrate aminotransferase